MKISIPTTDGQLSSHFGHCEQFAIFDVDDQSNIITNENLLTPPPHEPGLLPCWLAQQEVTLIIAVGMGHRAQQLFLESNIIDVIVGAPETSPRELVIQHLQGQLQCRPNACDH